MSLPWTELSVGALLAAGTVAYALGRRRRERRDEAKLASAVERNQHLPQSLHPVIDPDVCIGSLSCLKACPEGDILGVVDGSARLIRGTHCIGHGRCARECPVGAIKLVFGTSQRGVDLPEIDETFESSRSGVHVVGELGGMGLIRNAVTQGLEVAEYLSARPGPRAPDQVDVAIVGAGPAGLATALAAKKAGLTFRVLEQGTTGGTMSQYPRHKVVMTEAVELPFFGRIGRSAIRKEELVATWLKAIAKAGIRVEEQCQVTGLEGSDGAFSLQTTRGPVSARKVVLACGRRGTPRKLGVPGEVLPKVTYRLLDPEQYRGSKVLVVGGGDSALEAAIGLAESGVETALSYRNAELGRCRDANRERFDALVSAGRIRSLMPSTVKEVRAKEVLLDAGGAAVTLENDFVIVNIGGELPLEFLGKMGVEVKRFFGTAPTRTSGQGAGREELEARRRRRFALALGAVGALVIGFLSFQGWDYYLLGSRERLRYASHAALKSSGAWGHGIGLVATAFMLSNFLYAARKRLSFLKGRTSIRSWLTFHMFVGFMSPLVIVFHAAFQAKNELAAATFGSLLVVVLTGAVGRFIYGLVPSRAGEALEEAEVLAAFERTKAELEPLLAGASRPESVAALLAEASAPPRGGSAVGAALRIPLDSLRTRLRLAGARSAFTDAGQWADFRATVLQLAHLRIEAAFLRGFKRLLAGWRLFHAVLAVFLVVMIAGHIALSLYLGYRWIL